MEQFSSVPDQSSNGLGGYHIITQRTVSRSDLRSLRDNYVVNPMSPLFESWFPSKFITITTRCSPAVAVYVVQTLPAARGRELPEELSWNRATFFFNIIT